MMTSTHPIQLDMSFSGVKEVKPSLDASSSHGSDKDDDDATSTWGSADPHSNTADGAGEAKSMIGAAENQRVNYSRILVLVVLLVCAAATAGLAYALTWQEEQNDFEQEFSAMAEEIIVVTQTAEDNLVKIMKDFSTMVTSSALALGQVWPNVTIPDFGRRANASMDVSGGKMMDFAVAVDPTDASRAAWNEYSNKNIGWFDETHKVFNTTPGQIVPFMTNLNPKYQGSGDTVNPPIIPAFGDDLHLVSWQVSPPPPPEQTYIINLDWRDELGSRWDYMKETGLAARSPFINLNNILPEPIFDPVGAQYQPVYSDFEDTKTLVGILLLAVRWQDYFENLLHDDAAGIVVVLSSTCGDLATYEINGKNATFLGEEDFHDQRFDYMGVTDVLSDDILQGSTASEEGITCGYSLSVYPSSKLDANYHTSRPWTYVLVVLGIFAFTSLVFVMYDCLVQSRQETVMDAALKTDAIVNQLFPEQFREKMLENAAADQKKLKNKEVFRSSNAKASLSDFMGGNDGGPGGAIDDDLFLSKPVADLFPSVTVLFADICGFTAWSSVREPSQVFSLLETIYGAFDKIAKKRRVYKVETVGDAYVAVAGIPKPIGNHAELLARFARECCIKLPQVVHRLERHLGPGTGDLTMRFGLHSGPVTAGVLRGEKARFQLFGDTVNTASRIENAGVGNRVHLSENTANLLIAAGRSSWIEPRPDEVHLKGIGCVRTFWLVTSKVPLKSGSVYDQSDTRSAPGTDSEGGNATLLGDTEACLKDQTDRLVVWNTESLFRLLQQVTAGRKGAPKNKTKSPAKFLPTDVPLSEVVEVISLPGFDSKRAGKKSLDPGTVDLGPKVREQLYAYVSWVASAYNTNPFHNFEHASHVSMSVNKLLSRIVAPEINVTETDESKLKAKVAAQLHDHTYGITSDPLTQFACALAALIHDVDHRGVPNGRLMEEQPHLGKLYIQSAAEQNSVDVAWAKLMSDEFVDLRVTIYSSAEEMKRFRQVMVNTVLATDIFDKKLKALRDLRWDKAFHDKGSVDLSLQDSSADSATLQLDDVNRKATIVIEHIIQASDVSHTMQHWHVYTKWNEKLYLEQYLAYLEGRSATDPSDGWYKGELWFFDNYIIPLAKKLAECGVFGVSSDEYLNYALENRKEWEQKGVGIVEALSLKYRHVATSKKWMKVPAQDQDQDLYDAIIEV